MRASARTVAAVPTTLAVLAFGIRKTTVVATPIGLVETFAVRPVRAFAIGLVALLPRLLEAVVLVALGKSRLAVRARARLARTLLARVRVLIVRPGGRVAVRTRARLAWTRAVVGRGARRGNSIDCLRGGSQVVG